jgi:putative transposase
MQLVEQHMIRQSDSRFAAIDEAAFKAKNLYNLALYTQRQHFFDTGGYLHYVALYKALRDDPAYQALPRKVSQQVLRLLDQNFRSFFQANEEWKKDPGRFNGRPHPPKYKDKQQGRCILVYTIQALSGPALRQGIIKPSGLGIEVQTRQSDVDQLRIVPHADHYVVEVV